MYLFAYLQVFQVKKYLNVSGKQAVNKLLENGKNQWNYRILGATEL